MTIERSATEKVYIARAVEVSIHVAWLLCLLPCVS